MKNRRATGGKGPCKDCGEETVRVTIYFRRVDAPEERRCSICAVRKGEGERIDNEACAKEARL